MTTALTSHTENLTGNPPESDLPFAALEEAMQTDIQSNTQRNVCKNDVGADPKSWADLTTIKP